MKETKKIAIINGINGRTEKRVFKGEDGFEYVMLTDTFFRRNELVELGSRIFFKKG